MNQDSFTSNPAAFEETKGKHVPYSSQKSATYYTPLPAIPQEKDLAATGVFGGLVNLTLHMGTHYQTTQQQRLGTDGGFGAPLVTLSQEHITDTEGLPLEDDHLQYQLVKK